MSKRKEFVSCSLGDHTIAGVDCFLLEFSDDTNLISVQKVLRLELVLADCTVLFSNPVTAFLPNDSKVVRVFVLTKPSYAMSLSMQYGATVSTVSMIPRSLSTFYGVVVSEE